MVTESKTKWNSSILTIQCEYKLSPLSFQWLPRQSSGSVQWTFLPVFESHIACQVSPNTHLLLYWLPSATCWAIRCWLQLLLLPMQDMLRPCLAAELALTAVLCHCCFCLVSIQWPGFLTVSLLLPQKKHKKTNIQTNKNTQKKKRKRKTKMKTSENTVQGLYIKSEVPLVIMLD